MNGVHGNLIGLGHGDSTGHGNLIGPTHQTLDDDITVNGDGHMYGGDLVDVEFRLDAAGEGQDLLRAGDGRASRDGADDDVTVNGDGGHGKATETSHLDVDNTTNIICAGVLYCIADNNEV